jgi:hypothetical protein
VIARHTSGDSLPGIGEEEVESDVVAKEDAAVRSPTRPPPLVRSASRTCTLL